MNSLKFSRKALCRTVTQIPCLGQANRVALVLVISVLSQGCIPSFHSLVRDKRFPDAICHAESQQQAETLAKTIESNANARVHLYAVHENELESALGERGKAIGEQVTFVRIASGINEIPGKMSLTPNVVVTGENRVLQLSGSSYPPEKSAALLFALTQESLPKSTTTIDEASFRKELGWAVLTLGLKQLLFGTDTVTRTSPPGRDDFLRKGPKAMAIYDGLNKGGRYSCVGIPKAFENEAKLLIETQINTWHEEGGSCSLSINYEISLQQPGKTLTESIDSLFTQEAISVVQLGAKRTMKLRNPKGQWSAE